MSQDPPHGDTATSSPEQQERVLERLRAYGAVSAEISKGFAGSLDLHPTDAAALIEILEAEERGTPLSPARLAERIGLTTGATSSLLNRLESNGHIERTRVHSDRRIVSLRSTSGVRRAADAFFAPLAVRLAAMMNAYSDEVLQEFDSFLTELTTTSEAHLRSAPSREAPSRDTSTRACSRTPG